MGHQASQQWLQACWVVLLIGRIALAPALQAAPALGALNAALSHDSSLPIEQPGGLPLRRRALRQAASTACDFECTSTAGSNVIVSAAVHDLILHGSCTQLSPDLDIWRCGTCNLVQGETISTVTTGSCTQRCPSSRAPTPQCLAAPAPAPMAVLASTAAPAQAAQTTAVPGELWIIGYSQ